MKTRIVLLGPPCSGKSTLSREITKEIDIPKISMGSILRKHIKEDTELGKRVKQYVEKGELVPDSIVGKLIEKRLLHDDCKNGFILDGFPRTMSQVKILEEIEKRNSFFIDAVIALKIPNELVINRVEGRRSCEDCGAKYNLYDNPPKHENCDLCDGFLVKSREEDTKEVALKRLKDFHEQTKPAILYLDQKGLVKTYENYDLKTLGKEVLGYLQEKKNRGMEQRPNKDIRFLEKMNQFLKTSLNQKSSGQILKDRSVR
jgi:adenylate kinase